MRSSLLCAGTLAATVAAMCDRTFLNDMSAAYLSAQTKGDPHEIPSLSANLVYTEQFKQIPLNVSIMNKPLPISYDRTFYDEVYCTAFVEVVVTDTAHPYVIGTRMEADGQYITKMETLVSDEGDWLFNATGYAHYGYELEDWHPIPTTEQDSREVIQAAGDAYFDRFANANVSVPWGTPCARLEGGAYTGGGNLSANTCDLGLPSTIHVVDRRYVVDVQMGVVNIYVGFPGLDRASSEPTPDSHLFRVEKGKIKYIHTISTCEGHLGCGLNMTFPPGMRRKRYNRAPSRSAPVRVA
ncbi:hypothetical protein BU26DRAFT_488555 [Trematosphaeria pertusa]|uniref:DUF8021 domain-containing protein n=1 Tax=Trematosphaeria pertusa TaxID=390896 RepID=A0A6A6I5Q1_9PLEO|nr:uncharacterized protein BU26DRAFT_488555 [Trematosphaeria pertusa]KAF2245855.1 hypothetical protein BU26DRAFT_488555 [Trematosphaeria pertusa]